MQFEPLLLPEVVLIRPRVFGDARGFFFESWHREHFASAGIDAHFVQDNHSQSVRHTLRGLHFQIQQPQGKLVHVVRGEAFDVAVDMRRSSPRFSQWVGVRWPLPAGVAPTLSGKDAAAPLFKDAGSYP